MLNAPGESRVLSLDAMLPAVLGSLAGLLLAVQPPGREVRDTLRRENTFLIVRDSRCSYGMCSAYYYVYLFRDDRSTYCTVPVRK